MHQFIGKWITDSEFCDLQPRNVFHKQLDKIDLPCESHRNRHILFRKKFNLDGRPESATVYISADDYYKLYINGSFVAQGPAPSYHFNYNYNVIDVSEYLKEGENTVAVHTLYQGLINRVWVSGDNRHGLILDLVADGKTVVSSDETFLTKPHSAFSEMGTVGYDTQFLEQYDSRSADVGFESEDFDDSKWEKAKISLVDDHIPAEQKTDMLVFEKKPPVEKKLDGNKLFLDFGSNYVGYLCLTARGSNGDEVIIRCGQELCDDGSVRYKMRAVCNYEEKWILRDGESKLDQFDYKAFRYAEIILPDGCEITDAYFNARHYPFELKANIKKEYRGNPDIERIWDLCINTQKYGVQEVIQDCMEREKGFYLGDGCYTALTHAVLTGKDDMVRKLIDDAFETSFITDGLVTCMDCAHMQEIAEYPLILVFTVIWHYNLTGDIEYLKQNYPKVRALLDSYRRDYEKDLVLRDLDKWCVVDWPKNFRHGYDVDIEEGKVCKEAHVSINAYYIAAIRTANKIAEILNEEHYRDELPLTERFIALFYDKEKHLFRDGESTQHTCLVGNAFPFGFDICPDEEFKQNVINSFVELGSHSLAFFALFPMLIGLSREGRDDLIKEALLDKGAWLRMLDEGATTTFESWGKDTKWNTSLFHLTFSYASLFLTDIKW